MPRPFHAFFPLALLVPALPAAARESTLASQLAHGGTGIVVTGLLSVLALAVVLERLAKLRAHKLAPQDLADEARRLWRAGCFEEPRARGRRAQRAGTGPGWQARVEQSPRATDRRQMRRQLRTREEIRDALEQSAGLASAPVQKPEQKRAGADEAADPERRARELARLLRIPGSRRSSACARKTRPGRGRYCRKARRRRPWSPGWPGRPGPRWNNAASS